MIIGEYQLFAKIHTDRVEVHHATISDPYNILAFPFLYPSSSYELGDIIFVGTRRKSE
jgi:hypothetical protein